MASSSGSDFDSILGEGASYIESANILRQERTSRRTSSSSSPVIRVPDGSPAATVTLTSSITAEEIYGDDLTLEDDRIASVEGSVEEEVTYDPLMNNEILKRQHEKKLKREQRKAAGGIMRYVKNPLLLVKGKDFSDVTLTILIPAFVSYLVLKKASEIGFGKLGEVAEDLYERAANEIAYHSGDYEEMELAYKDYKKKLWFNGAPNYVRDEILKRFAAVYCKKENISPKSVSSLAYVLTMMKISDVDAADCFVEACRTNPNSMAIASKLLFYSTHIFKDEAAKKKMKPLIKQLSTMSGGMEFMKIAQENMGEAAYRDAVAAAGPGQTKLTEGWKLLGLDKGTATRIFEETKELGFLSREELMEKERRDDLAEDEPDDSWKALVDKDGNVVGEVEEEDVSGDSAPSGSVKECGNCGYTLFIAPGRDSKFFQSSFVCPECGAGRDQFKSVEFDE